MAQLTRRRIDSTIEKRIVTGLITNKRFLTELKPLLSLEYFNSKHLKTLAKWSIDYYNTYETTANEHIQDVFNRRGTKLKEEEREAIEKLLGELSERYAYQPTINVEYLLDQSIEYLKKRELEITIGNAQVLLDNNNVKEAEVEFQRYRQLEKFKSKAVSPFDPNVVKKIFEENEVLFKMPGDLGKFIGTLEKYWLVGVTGPFKRGKTWILQEFALEAMLSNLSVAFVSLEMSENQMSQRIIQRILGLPKKEGGTYNIPAFDCGHNQDGTCKKEERSCRVTLLTPSGEKPRKIPKGYEPCTSCRGTPSFDCQMWFRSVERPDFEQHFIVNRIKNWQKKYKDNFQLFCYPRFSANLSDIERDLRRLEHEKGYVPDVIVIDYADILKPEEGSASSGIEQIDYTWKCLAKLAGERHALVITGAQATREALEAESVRQKHTALWIGKLAHVDAMLSLNQTPEEKATGVMRIGMMVHRHEDFNEEDKCVVLQNLQVGQTYLDSYWRR